MGKLLWLASYPRSGNTWLRAFLHNLLRNPQEPYDINRLGDLTVVGSHARWYRPFDPRLPSQMTKEEVAQLRPRVQQALTTLRPDTVFVKTHNALVEDRGTPMISPECTAGAIYVLRNPLDVAVSYSVHFGLPLAEAVAAMNRPGNQSIANQDQFVYEVHGSWSENVLSWTSQDVPSIRIIRYEDMLHRPETTFGEIARFLQLPVSRERLDRAVRNSAFAVLKEQENKAKFAERSAKSEVFFRAGTSGEGRRLLGPELVESLCNAHQAQMARFGYWPLPPD